MPNDPQFPGQYRGSGQIALLCEGDGIGYEAQFLGMWMREFEPEMPQVDVWACGTADGIFAMADAIGRFVRIVAIEDRDFRTVGDAQKECAEKHKSRELRGVAMRGWTAWKRSEIENYFLDDDVLVPVMKEMFQCSQADVFEALGAAINALGPYQAFAATRDEARRLLKTTDPAEKLSVTARPKWTKLGLQTQDPDSVRQEFEQSLAKWQQRYSENQPFGNVLHTTVLRDEFNRRLEEWSGLTREDHAWRSDWGGKEVLKLVRQILAARAPGWWSIQKDYPVVWSALGGRPKQDEHDRRIERELQPHLVKRLFELVLHDAPVPLRNELDQLTKMLSL